MNTLALTFAVCSIVALAFLAWLFTPWGRSGRRNCSDEEDKIYIMRLPDDGKLGHGSQVDEGLAGFDARFC